MKKVFLQKCAKIFLIGLFLALPVFAFAQTGTGSDLPPAPVLTPDIGNGATPPPGAGVGSTPNADKALANPSYSCDPPLQYVNGVCLPQKQCAPGSITCVDSLSDLLLLIIKDLLFFAGIVAVLFVIIGGFWYITAQGNEEQAEKGRNTLVNAIIGIIVVTMAYVIVSVVSNTLNAGTAAGTANPTTTGAPSAGNGQTPGVDNSSGGSRGPIVF